jgi:hypothetical protein
MQGALTYTPYFWASYVSRLEPVQAETQGMEGIHILLLSHKLALKTKNKNISTHKLSCYWLVLTIQSYSNLMSVIRSTLQVHIAWSKFHYSHAYCICSRHNFKVFIVIIKCTKIYCCLINRKIKMYLIYRIIKKLLLFVFLRYIHNYNSSNEHLIRSTIFSNKLTCALNWIFQFTILSGKNHAKFCKKENFFVYIKMMAVQLCGFVTVMHKIHILQ